MKRNVKKLTALLLCLLMLCTNGGLGAFATGTVWSGSAATAFGGGAGTQESPYLISNGEQLAFLANQVNAGTTYAGVYFALAQDVVLNDTADLAAWSQGAPANVWAPIGTFGKGFGGIFDGGEHTVFGLYLSGEEDYQGLFGYVDGGTVMNLTLSDSYVKGNNYVAGLVACLAAGTVSGCENNATVTGNEGVAGVVGEAEILADNASATVEKCTNSGTVTGNYALGGIAGAAVSFGTDTALHIAYCVNNGNVSGYENVGGIAGVCAGGTVKGCVNNGNVSGTNAVAGVAGYNEGTVASCLNSGTVSGVGIGGYIGGVSGLNLDTVTDCSNSGTVDGGKLSAVGGIAGGNGSDTQQATVANSVNTGSVCGVSGVGALAGETDAENSTVSNCYYLEGSAVDGNGVAQNGVGSDTQGTVTQDTEGQTLSLTEEEMEDTSSFEGLDFDDTWGVDTNGNIYLKETKKNCDHTYEETVIDATCTVDGKKTYTCSKCGDTYYEVITAGGHHYGNWYTVTPATLDAPGTERRDCEKGDGYETRDIPQLTVTGLAVKTSPAKTEYTVGDTLDTAGLVLEETYSDGTSADITTGYTCSPTALSKDGTQTVTVTFRGNTATFSVTVSKVKYQAVFVAEGVTVDTVEYTDGTKSIPEPDVPAKAGYTGKWDNYTLAVGGVTIQALYAPILYSAVFKAGDTTVDTVEYTVETESITEPTVPEKPGYTGVWEKYSLAIGGITVNAEYTAITYVATFVAEGKPIKEVQYTVETKSITEPAVPEKTGYTGKWESYTLATGGVTVQAVYTLETYTVSFVSQGNLVQAVEYTVETESIEEPAVPKVKGGFNGRWENYNLHAYTDLTVNAIYDAPSLQVAAQRTLRVGNACHAFTSANFAVTAKDFSSTDSSVATVDALGNITAVGEGECVVDVTVTGLDDLGNPVFAFNHINVVVKTCVVQESGLKAKLKNAFYDFFRLVLPDITENLKRFFFLLSLVTEQ